MDSACYYTFSTVCQMLAGAFGFLVAVVLYRIQGMDHMLFENIDWAFGWGIDIGNEYQTARKARDWPCIARMLRKTENPPQAHDPQTIKVLGEGKDRFLALADKLQSVKAGLRFSLRLTGVTIGSSLALLPLTPVIAHYCVVAGILLAVDVAAAFYCLYGYYKLAEGAAE
jgi:hypothetical protein